eukprot:TRINITY_DN18751_c0_g1_i1.p1 TRINITY_DN18751_c0_g1~~TRINITY_DN18751_c0_g1_i1.p1  ORF type:complete len:302 (+),score=57.04 TRINITY_DN18751_c0_g1_i1:64-969(+)
MTYIVKDRKGKELLQFQGTKTEELKKEMAKKYPKYKDPNRQRFTYTDAEGKNQALKPDSDLSKLKINDNVLTFKDLGLQVGWSTVFLTEYAGPLFVVLGIYLLRDQLYGARVAAGSWTEQVQLIGTAAWIAHYAKRLLETIFVHHFSNATMPILNIFKNSAYYWGFAFLNGYYLLHPQYTAPASNQVYAGLALFTVSELCNFITHVMLRNLRPAGTRVRRIPRGFLFELVSCPNYFFEVLAWVGFTIMTQMAGAALFTFAGFFQMLLWALGKHRNYRKEFDGKEGREMYPKGRKAMIPFII